MRDALNARGYELPADYLIEKPYGIDQGRQAMRTLMTNTNRPSAVVGGNDLLALGAVLECQTNGLNVPNDISIAGFDDMELSSHIPPSLTTMRVPTRTMGQRAAEFVLARLSGEERESHVQLDVELIVRGSTAPPTGTR